MSERQTPPIDSAQFSVQCPATGQVCPARENLVRLYAEPVDEAIAEQLPLGLRPQFNGVKLGVKLAEMDVQAQLRSCGGAEEDVCPVRGAMNESPARRTVVQALRAMTSAFFDRSASQDPTHG